MKLETQQREVETRKPGDQIQSRQEKGKSVCFSTQDPGRDTWGTHPSLKGSKGPRPAA